MRKSFIYSLFSMLFTAMITFSFTACGSDDGNKNPGGEGDDSTPASIIGKWKLMTIDNAGNPTGTWEIYCFNADGTGYSQELDAYGTATDIRPYTYTFENGAIRTYKKNGKLKDVLLNVVVTATTLTATSPDGFTATMTRVHDEDHDTDNDNGGNDDNDDNTTVTPDTPSETAGTAIDLGLSVKWASCNIGATKPEEYGSYYAWGETEEKNNYSWSNYIYCNGTFNSITKYCTDNRFGTDDGKTTLEPTDDVATVKWGAGWRTPTNAELSELVTKCTWEWSTLNNINGYRVTGPNGNSIFLPATGLRPDIDNLLGTRGYYWSSSVHLRRSAYVSDESHTAYYLNFSNGYYYAGNNFERCYGFTVRPVSE